MKNIIKRGTSLLLVLAMLLSFAAVVGATDATTTTPEKILTLTVENKLLRAGQTEYLAVYEQVAGDYKINALTISATSTNSKVAVKGIYPWIPKSYSGGAWDYDYDTRETVFSSRSVGGDPIAAPPTADPLLVWTSTSGFQTSTKPLCFIKVEAQADVTPGAYQINICRNPHPEKEDDYFLFAYADPVTTEGVSQTEENATLNPGTAVVIPADATLPTVILTQSSFAAPTQAGLAVGGEAAGDYDLTKYVKLVTEEGLVDVTSLSVTVNGDKSVSLKQGNVLSLATTAEKDKGYKLTVTAANGKQLAAAVELPFTVSKQDSAFTMAGFTKNGGYSMDFAGPYEAPAYSGTTANKFVPLDPKAYDQYGMPMEQATTELKLYSDAACTKEITSGNAVESVTVSESTGSVQISRNLQADVWCKVRASATIDGVTKTSDWITFQIKSNYPQPRKAILSLTDGSGNPFSGDAAKGTFDIPGGSGRTTIKFAVDKFLDKNGGEMTSATAPMGYTVSAVDPSVGGVTVDNTNKTIEVTSEAVKFAPVEIEIKVTLADNTELTGILKVGTEELPAKITLKKGNSFAIALASYDSDSNSYAKGEIRADSYEGNALPTVLPGIGGDKASVVLAPLYVLDQYDAVMQTVAAANYKLYKVDGETKTPISADYAKFENGTEDRVTLKLTNALAGEEGAKSLALTAGNYQIEATYNNKTAIARFTMAEATEKTYVATVTAEITTNGYTGDKSVKTLPVPYAHGGTSQQRQTPEITYTATVTDQYGKTPADGTNVVAKITSIKLGTSQADYINDNSSKFIVPNGTTNAARLQVTKELATVMNLDAADSVVVHVGLTVTADGKPATVESVPDYTFTTDEPKLGSLGVYLRTDENTSSALGSWSSNATNNPEALTVVAPAGEGTTRNVLDFAVYDQYRRSNGFAKALTKGWLVKGDLPTGMTFGDKSLTAGSIYEVTVTKDAVGKTFTITAPAAKNVAGTDWTVKVTAVAVEFVNGEGSDATRYELSDYLTNGTFSAEYNGQPWSAILAKNPDAKVYIKTAEGESNTEISSDKLTLEVTKDGAPVGMDAKANAGSYQVKLVYTDENKQTYTVDEKTFTITPKTVTITANRAITKEYDGTANLPDVTLDVTAYETLNVDKSVLKFAQENVGTDINVELTSAGTNCLKTASGEPATNYTADLSELKGTIAPRKLIVTPKAETFEYGENDKITAALAREYTVSNNLEGEKAATITGSMKLTDTTSGADVTVYNAGTYNVALGNLSLTGTSAGNYQLELASGTHWTISKKSVDPFNVTLEAEYGINGSELYAMMKAAKVTVDGQEVSLNTLYNVEALYIKDVDGNNVPKTDALVNAGEYTVTSLPATTLGIANYEFKTAPTLKIKVKPHTLTSADIQSTDNWGTKDFTGEEQTFTAFKVSFTYNERTIDLVENQDYVIVDNSNKGIYSVVTLRIKAADGSTNYTGEARAPQSWSIRAFKVRTGDLEIYQTNTLIYDGTPKTAEFAVRVISADPARQKVLRLFTIPNNIVDMWGNTATDAGEHTAGGSFAKGFSTADGGVNVFTWKILKSDKSPIQNQSASTKYGQPGSKEISVSDGAAKGLDTSDLSVLVLTDTNSIIKGTPSVTFENGKIIVNWQLQGDATTIDKTATLRVTVAETDNYKQYTFDVDVTVTAKTPQTNFGFTTATDATVGYAEDTYTNPVQNAKTTPAYTSSNQNVATVASNGVVTILDVGTTTITANAPENGEYASATASYTLTVVSSTLTVTASSATMTANDSVPSFTASVTGLKRGQTTAQVFQTLTASAATDGKTAGTYAVNASATLKTDFVPRYTLRFVPGTLTVNPAQTAIDVVLPIIIGGNTCANGYANCACESFYDLDASRWYHEAIDWAYNLGLMNGTTKSTFGPNAAATRAQTWTMLARIAGQDTRRSSTWYEVGQKWAMNLGITDGTNPMGSLTREQLAAMLYRYVGSPAVNGTLTFTDSANVSAWARNAMIWAVQNGILDGVGGNRLNPKGTTTRAQAAAIFMRFSKLINK